MARRTAQRMVSKLNSKARPHRPSSCCRESQTSSISSRGSTAINTLRPSFSASSRLLLGRSPNSWWPSQASSPVCGGNRGASPGASQCTRTWRRLWVSRGCRLAGSCSAVSPRYATTASADCNSRSTSATAWCNNTPAQASATKAKQNVTHRLIRHRADRLTRRTGDSPRGVVAHRAPHPKAAAPAPNYYLGTGLALLSAYFLLPAGFLCWRHLPWSVLCASLPTLP